MKKRWTFLAEVAPGLLIVAVVLAMAAPVVIIVALQQGPSPIECAKGCEKSGLKMSSTGPDGCKCAP